MQCIKLLLRTVVLSYFEVDQFSQQLLVHFVQLRVELNLTCDLLVLYPFRENEHQHLTAQLGQDPREYLNR
jgi:hypothetical protein